MENQQRNKFSFMELPDKRYFTISEAAKLCQVKPHILRYWEQEFPSLNPMKRDGNRRYYKHKDIELIFHIKDLLYCQGYTIAGARAVLSKKSSSKKTVIIKELKEVLSVLDA